MVSKLWVTLELHFKTGIQSILKVNENKHTSFEGVCLKSVMK